jgi:cyanate permease
LISGFKSGIPSAIFFGGVTLGALTFGFTIGDSVGPLISGYLFDLSGNYTASFLITAAMGIIGLILTFLLKPLNQAGV